LKFEPVTLIFVEMVFVQFLIICVVNLSCNTYYHLSLQITYGILFSLVVTFVSDALSTSHEKASLPSDSSFRREFHELVSFKTHA
jgi:hypothetical protein